MDRPNSGDNFFGIDLQIAGTPIDCSGGPLTPEIIEAGFKAILERSGRATCEGNDGVIRHLVNPRRPDYCIVCGWDTKGCEWVGPRSL